MKVRARLLQSTKHKVRLARVAHVAYIKVMKMPTKQPVKAHLDMIFLKLFCGVDFYIC